MATLSLAVMDPNIKPAPQLLASEFDTPPQSPQPQQQQQQQSPPEEAPQSPQQPPQSATQSPEKSPQELPSLDQIEADQPKEDNAADLPKETDAANSAILSDDEDAFSGRNVQKGGGDDDLDSAMSDDLVTSDAQYLLLSKFFMSEEGRNIADLLVDISTTLKALLAEPRE